MMRPGEANQERRIWPGIFAQPGSGLTGAHDPGDDHHRDEPNPQQQQEGCQTVAMSRHSNASGSRARPCCQVKQPQRGVAGHTLVSASKDHGPDHPGDQPGRMDSSKRFGVIHPAQLCFRRSAWDLSAASSSGVTPRRSAMSAASSGRRQRGPSQIGPGQVSPIQVGVCQVGSGQPGSCKLCIRELCSTALVFDRSAPLRSAPYS